jgi:hypothetical protein
LEGPQREEDTVRLCLTTNECAESFHCSKIALCFEAQHGATLCLWVEISDSAGLGRNCKQILPPHCGVTRGLRKMTLPSTRSNKQWQPATIPSVHFYILLHSHPSSHLVLVEGALRQPLPLPSFWYKHPVQVPAVPEVSSDFPTIFIPAAPSRGVLCENFYLDPGATKGG